ncbi:MAG: MCE family protein [Bacteroidetes bacterium]|nr:MCE family protein [Bacteroidota bacterium]MCH7771341.1 MCE family protein [Bacteroidota bacterium]
MKNERKTEIKVGITTVISLIIFIWILAWAKNLTLTSDDIIVNLTFENVSGLEVDDQVTVKGLRKGFVDDIYLDGNKIFVKISVDNNVDLRKDAKFWIATTDLMGGKKIEIIPGESIEMLDLNSLHTGLIQPDLNSMMAIAGSMMSDVETIVDDLKITFSTVNNYLSDDEMMIDLKSSLRNLKNLTEKFNALITDNSDNITRITENIAAISEESRTFFDENRESLDSSIKKFNIILSKSDSLVSRFNFLAAETMEGNNNLGRILYDDSLMINMQETLKILNELSKLVLYQIKTDGFKVDANIW